MFGFTRLMGNLHLCSILVLFYSLSMLPPLLVAIYYQDPEPSTFFNTFILISIGAGLAVSKTRKYQFQQRNRDAMLIAVLFWLILSLVSALPFIFEDVLALSLTDAIWEGISGLTTTGASVLSNLETLPRSIIYYRAQLNFLGGLGIIVLAVAILPILGTSRTSLHLAEVPGPTKDERLTPRLADTAKNIWIIYVVLAAICALSYWWVGMDWFDAICHSMSTVSLGGFSPHDASLGYYNSLAVEIVGALFTIVAATNFALYFYVHQKLSLQPIINDPEFRFFIGIALLLASITSLGLFLSDRFDLIESLVHGSFQTFSVMTDNGLGAAGYPDWPLPLAVLLITSSFIGGCVGSTCGGIKVMRIYLLYKEGRRELLQLIHPHGVFTIKIAGKSVEERVIRTIWAFCFFYVLVAILFIIGLLFTGEDLATAYGTTAACLNNMGIGFGKTAGGFGELTDASKWLMCMAMLVGRLEIFPLILMLRPEFWRA